MKEQKPSAAIRRVFHFAYALNLISQAAFSLLCPAGLCIGAGWLLTYRLGAGRWVLVLAIVLGVLMGFYSMIYYLIKYGTKPDPTVQPQKRGERHGADAGRTE